MQMHCPLAFIKQICQLLSFTISLMSAFYTTVTNIGLQSTKPRVIIVIDIIFTYRYLWVRIYRLILV